MDLIGQSIGNYVVRRRLGGGGMGTVYICEHPLIGRRVALKVLHEELATDPEIVSRFFHEAKAANDIRHENIVDILDFGRLTSNGSEVVYIVMELLDGEPLGHRLREGPLQDADLVHILIQCCRALQASHDHGIVHRDLKPDNIYLVHRTTDPLFVKLLDFGIAKLTGDHAEGPKTRIGTILGTPAYMSPEQCEGKGQIDHRSDIYSLGVVMFEMLTGKVPFFAPRVTDIILAHLGQEPTDPIALNPRASPALGAICLHALEKRREQRFQSMDQFAEALRNPAAHLARYHRQPLLPREVGPAVPPLPSSEQATVLMHQGASETARIEHAEEAPSPVIGVAPGPTVGGSPAVDGAPPSTLQLPQDEEPPPLEVHAPASGRAGTLRWALLSGAIGLAGVALVAVLVGIFAQPRGAAPQPPARGDPAVTAAARPAPLPAAPPPTTAPAAAWVAIEIRSDPDGAAVVRKDRPGEVAGITPFTLRLRRGESTVIELRRDGYLPLGRALVGDTDKSLSVTLAPEGPKQQAAPTKAKAKKKKVEKSPFFLLED